MARLLWTAGIATVCVVVATETVHPQTTTNPDISVIPRFRILTDDGGKLSPLGIVVHHDSAVVLRERDFSCRGGRREAEHQGYNGQDHRLKRPA